jgi:hypothetical protein
MPREAPGRPTEALGDLPGASGASGARALLSGPDKPSGIGSNRYHTKRIGGPRVWKFQSRLVQCAFRVMLGGCRADITLRSTGHSEF